MQRTVDIIIPIFNHAEYLTRCLESALAQTHPARRVICIDDASSDSQVASILGGFASRHPRLQVITLPENKGICFSQNVGVRASAADYIAFLDCDDWLPEDALRVVMHAIAETSAGYIFTDRFDFNDETSAIDVRSYGGQPHLRTRRTHAENLLDHMVASHLKVIRRELLEEVGGFAAGTDGVQDWDVALKISELTPLTHIPKALYYHRIHSLQNSSCANVANIRKTNQVRRGAQARRFKSVNGTPRRASLKTFLDGMRSAAPDFLDTLAASQVILALDHEGKISFSPQDRRCIRALMDANAITEVLIFGRGELYIELLKDFWLQPTRPTVGFYLDDIANLASSIWPLRWGNSYLDYIVCGSMGQISLLGYTHQDLELLGG